MSGVRIVIVGGVAAGASAATRARRLNEQAEITVFEKGAAVSFANCGLPYYVGGVIADRRKLLLMTPEAFARRFRIEVRVRHEVTRIDRAAKRVEVLDRDTSERFEHPYDKLILATGASPIIPPLPGLDSSNVFVLRSLEDAEAMRAFVDENELGRAVLVGGGFIGLEVAESLRTRDIEVHVVERGGQVLSPFDPEMAGMLTDALERHGVRLHLGDGLEGVEHAGGVVTAVRTKSGERIETDLVLLAIGVRPSVTLAQQAGLGLGEMGGLKVNEHLQTSDADILGAGDGVEVTHGVTGKPMLVPLAGPASRLGRLAGEFAATSKAPQAHKVMGTAVVQVFDRVAACTGLSEKLAGRLGVEARSVLIRRPHHVGYYPGAKELALKLVYEPGSRRVLGAQAVGSEGVEKRIDVVATAMNFGATIDDLCGLDLAYAPQFGAAKDPLHIAAQAACNQQDGLVEYVQPAELLEGSASAGALLDVRTPAEFAAGSIPGARHIPLDELRDRIQELPDGEALTVFCKSGQRSYLAARILQGLGRSQVKSLNGGYDLYMEMAAKA